MKFSKLRVYHDAPQPYTETGCLAPLCAGGACRHHDGKRCKLLGFVPQRVCEPAVEELAAELRARGGVL